MKTTLYTLAVLVLAVTMVHAGDPFEGARGKVTLEQPIKECRSAIKYRELPSSEATKLLNRYPWDKTHCFLHDPLKDGRVVVWTDDKKTYLGWPMYVFGTFSKEGKLVDLIGSHYGYTIPLINGTYAKRVVSLRKGMSVTEMYGLVGTQKPTYKENKDGKWIVEFTYNGYPGQFYHVEADAATGIITLAGNWTI
jgi:hypothetical protein